MFNPEIRPQGAGCRDTGLRLHLGVKHYVAHSNTTDSVLRVTPLSLLKFDYPFESSIQLNLSLSMEILVQVLKEGTQAKQIHVQTVALNLLPGHMAR